MVLQKRNGTIYEMKIHAIDIATAYNICNSSACWLILLFQKLKKHPMHWMHPELPDEGRVLPR